MQIPAKMANFCRFHTFTNCTATESPTLKSSKCAGSRALSSSLTVRCSHASTTFPMILPRCTVPTPRTPSPWPAPIPPLRTLFSRARCRACSAPAVAALTPSVVCLGHTCADGRADGAGHARRETAGAVRGEETAGPAHGVRSRVSTVSRTVGRSPAAHAHVCRTGMMLSQPGCPLSG